MKKAIFGIFLIFLLSFGAGAVPSVSARSAILIEANTGQVLFEKNADEELPMASVTKMMTALLVLERVPDLSELVTVSESAVRTEGSALYLKPGEQLSVSDLLYGLMLESGNDAANLLAEYVAGDNESFAALMTERARALGATHTVFQNPSGLPADGHYSTARDLALIAKAALQNETFRQIVSTERATIEATDQYGVRYLKNHNKLLNLYDGAIGVKTGFTKKAGRCLVSAAERNGIRLIAVTLNAGDDWNDHIKLFDFGFPRVTGVGEAIPIPKSIPLVGGTESTAPLQCDLSRAVIVDGEMKFSVELPRFLYAGGQTGTQVGVVHIETGGATQQFPITLVADTPIKVVKKSFFEKLFEFFQK